MDQYTTWASKIDDIDTSSLSKEDYAYYVEVTTRASGKLIAAGA